MGTSVKRPRGNSSAAARVWEGGPVRGPRELSGLPLLAKALGAVDGAFALGDEGALGHLAALAADGGVHRGGGAAAEAGEGAVMDVALAEWGREAGAAGATTGRAAAGLVLEASVSVEG